MKTETYKVLNVLVKFERNDSGYVSVTEWANGEGFDVETSVDTQSGGFGGDGRIGFTWDQWKATKKAIRKVKKKHDIS